MTVSAINSTGMYGPLTSQAPAEIPEEHVLLPAEEETGETEPSAIADENVTETESETEAKGVLRLLQAGHFKGVADVRLRINFHEEIAALEAAKAAQVAAESVSSLMDTMNSEIDGYLGEEIDEETASLVTEARDAFAAELTSIVGDDTSQVPTDGLASQIRAAFEEFIASVTPISETPPEEPAEGTPDETAAVSMTQVAMVEEGVTEAEATAPVESDTGLSIEEFIAGLTATFEAGLQELESSLADIRVLPPLSEPSGNGRAYDKFVAIYNEMRSSETAQTIDTNL